MKTTTPINEIKAPVIALPTSGGTVRAADENYHANAFTGAAELSIPVPLPASRALTPTLQISYSSSSGNGVLGMGFHLNISAISIKTNRAFPKYNNEDIYTLDDAELVFSATETIQQNGEQVTVDTYLERFQVSFSLIQRFSTASNVYWKVTTNDNTCTVYGDTAASRIADPQDSSRIFAWQAAWQNDATGNTVQYGYEKLDPQDANSYLTHISYGNYLLAGNKTVFAFKVWIDYGQLAISLSGNNLHFSPIPQTPARRKDIISAYRSGFAIRTQYLVKHILVVNNFPNESTAGEDCITSVMAMTYSDVQDAAACSTLVSIAEYGAARVAANDYSLKAMPPLVLDYAVLNPQQLLFKPITNEKGQIFNQPLNLVDLHREGLPGILYRNAETLRFYPAKGNGIFQTPAQNLTAPNRFADPALPMHIVSLEGNGELQVALDKNQYSGYYAQDQGMQWEPFTPFPQTALNNIPTYTHQLDLSGANRSDQLVITPHTLFYRESLGLEGMGTSLHEVANTHAVEAERMTEPFVYYGFDNFFGDGLQHRVKITGNVLTVWPNLGYGNFGAPLTLTLPITVTDETDLQQRLLLADVSGSGTADLVYIYADRIEVCFSYGGLSFSRPQSFLFQNNLEWTDTDHIQFTDVAGKGNICMILSKLSPHTYNGKFQDTGHYFYEFNGAEDSFCHKPFLLQGISCNGASRHISYKSSLQYMLADKALQPWYTTLPFPVIVVAQEQVTDQISNNVYTHQYQYRDGYYDPEEHLFFGFGCCSDWNVSSDTPTALSKTWFHLGNGLNETNMQRQFFDAGKDFSDIPAGYYAAGSNLTALSGKTLHHEVWDTGNATCPYTAESNTWQLLCTQAATNGHQAVYRSYNCQTVTFNYEQRAADPLVHHSFVLMADPYTHPLCDASLVYPRRLPLIPEQQKQYCTGNVYTLQNQDAPGLPRHIGVPVALQSFEITGLKPPAKSIYSFEEFKLQVADDTTFLHQVPPSAQPGAGEAARLVAWLRQYYWANENQQATWQPGMALPAILLQSHTSALSFDNTDISNMLSGQVSPEELAMAGYMQDTTHYWWAHTARAYYGPVTGFCLLQYLRYDWVAPSDRLYRSTTIAYDPYFLQAISNSQYLDEDTQLTTRAAIDYSIMKPYRVTDINNNYAEALYDACGQIIATAAIDKSGNRGDEPLKDFHLLPVTDIEEVCKNPLKYLQGAGTFVYYQFATETDGHWQPGFTLELSRTMYRSNDNNTVHISIAYADAMGRPLETRLFKDGTTQPWIVSGRVTYNAIGEVKAQYTGYFGSSWQYEQNWNENIKDLLPPPATFTYDALGRQVRSYTPKGFMLATLILNAWETRHYDANDTILESTYYKGGTWNNNPQEKEAIAKAVACYNTPVTQVADGMGRNILTVANNASGITTPINWQQPRLTTDDINAQNPTLEVSWQSYDITGRILRQQDARFTDQGGTNFNFEHIYPIASGLVHINSSDGGMVYGYSNVHGLVVAQWNPLGIKSTFVYDRLGRQLTKKVQTPAGYTPAADQVVELIIYGESSPLGMMGNMMGTLWKHYNEGGLSYADAFTFDQHPVNENFQFRKDYKTEPRWDNLFEDLLETEVFTTTNTYNAAGKIIAATRPDGTTNTWTYSALGYCRQSSINASGSGKTQSLLAGSDIDANGHLTQVSYANGMYTTQQYDPLTLQVRSVKCTRGAYPVQQLDFWYDAAGHITAATNSQQSSIFFNNQKVNPVFSYTYDSNYRLQNATGRMQLQPQSLDALENYTESYHYDKGNNLTQLRRNATNGFTRQFSIDDESNRITAVSVGRNNFAIGYNGAGYMLNIAGENSRAINWNINGNIASATIIARASSPNDTEYYVYSNGIRVRKITETYNDQGTLLNRIDKRYIGSYKRTSATTGDTLHSITVNGAYQHDCVVQYFTAPQSKTITKPPVYRFQQVEDVTIFSMETNLDGGLISYEEYSPFGDTVYRYDPAHLDSTREYRYSQREKDSFTGLYYYGFRYYAPWLCRWTRPDPAGTIDGLNLYAFVANAPVADKDILGLGRINRKKKPLTIKAQKAKNKYKVYKNKHAVRLTAYYGSNTRLSRRSVDAQKTARILAKVEKYKQAYRDSLAGSGGSTKNYDFVVTSVKAMAHLSLGQKVTTLFAEISGKRTFTRYGFVIDSGMQGPHTNSRVNVLELTERKYNALANKTAAEIHTHIFSGKIFTVAGLQQLEGAHRTAVVDNYITYYGGILNRYNVARANDDVVGVLAHGQSLMDLHPYATSRSVATGGDIAGDGEKRNQTNIYKLFDYPSDHRYAGDATHQQGMRSYILSFLQTYGVHNNWQVAHVQNLN